jgi:hypothetical protein
MEEWEELINQIESLPVDLRLEVVLADLVETGVSLDNVIINPDGIFKRRYQKDIGLLEVIENLFRVKQLYIHVNRESIYDTLPEGLIHQPSSRKHSRSTDETLKEIKLNRQREKAARQFFLPLEQEFYRQRIMLELEERQYLLDDEDDAQSDIFMQFWNLPSFLDAWQAWNLIHLLPLTYRMVGDFAFTAQCFEMLLGDPVQIALVHPPSYQLPNTNAFILNKSQLGMNAVLGDTYRETVQAVEIRIGPLSHAEAARYLPDEKKMKILEFLCGYFIPYEHDVMHKIVMREEDSGFILSEDIVDGRLGFTTQL